MKLRPILLALAALIAVAFVVQGGEFGTSDLLRQRSRERALSRAIDSLQRDIDSLVAVKAGIERDPAVQERIAREAFGMVRGEKEILYRIVDEADSAGAAPARQP